MTNVANAAQRPMADQKVIWAARGTIGGRAGPAWTEAVRMRSAGAPGDRPMAGKSVAVDKTPFSTSSQRSANRGEGSEVRLHEDPMIPTRHIRSEIGSAAQRPDPKHDIEPADCDHAD
jgi:hypothetical protein